MMDRKYELVAFTENVTDAENARLYMIPELELELQEPLYTKLSGCYLEKRQNNGIIDAALAQKFLSVYEECARLDFLTGHPKDGIVFLCMACEYAAMHDELAFEFIRLRDEATAMAHKHDCMEVLINRQCPLVE